jgi:tetratricopeptide (TPR) repeat protein
MLVPLRLLPMYELPETLSFSEPRFALAALAVVSVTGLLLAAARRWPAPLIAWLAFAAFVSPVLGLLQVGPQLVADRYSYLAGLPLALLAGGGALWLGSRGPRARVLVFALAGLVVVGSMVATWRYAAVWRDSESLWSYAYRTHPQSPVATLNLANARARASDRERLPERRHALAEQARELLELGFERSGEPRFLVNLAAVHGRLARLEPERREQHLQEAARLSGRGVVLALERGRLIPKFRLQHGVDLARVGRLDLARHELELFVAAEPASFEGRLFLGSVLRRLALWAEAVPELERAVELAPGRHSAWLELARALEGAGARERAALAYRRALALGPDDAHARRELDALGAGP